MISTRLIGAAASTRCWAEPMISFDLRCAHAHVFEIWFRSSTDYEDQRTRGLIQCPVCGDADVTKAVMAPNVSAKGNRAVTVAAPQSVPDRSTPPSPPMMAGGAASALPPEAVAMLSAIARAQAEALPQSRWVGKRFAEEARAQHASGEDAAQPIHGQATPQEAEALLEDGIAVMPLLVPIVPPDMQN